MTPRALILSPLALAALAVGCAQPEPVAWCESSTKLDYAPDPALSFTTFPDDHWTEANPESPTGLRVAMAVADTPVLDDYPENYVDWFDHLSTLDGWGLAAGGYFMFDGDVNTLTEEDVMLVALTEEGPVRYAVDLVFTDRDETVIWRPRLPLPESTEIVAAVLTDPDDAGCLSPSPHLRKLLAPETELEDDEDELALSGRFIAGLDALGVEPAQIAAMTVFTTQSATLVSRQVAEDIRSRDYGLTEPMSCTQGAGYRDCLGSLEVMDYRGPDRLVPSDSAPQPRGSYALPVRLWVPDGEGPFPAIICGHGLGGSTSDCEALVDEVVANGVVMIGVDAVEHGDHPTKGEAAFELLEALMIFAIDIDPPGMNGLRLRDNFRQSAWDKLQLIEALVAGWDIELDGTVDIDGERLAYAGVSLGAIMGPELLALSDSLQAGWLAVGGGRVTSIIQDSPTFSVLIDLMKPPGSDEGTVDRAFPVLQTLVDAGDPMIYGPHIVRDRLLDDDWEPSVVLLFAKDDEIVPNTTNDLLARSVGVPGVGAELWPVDDLDFAPGDLSGNLELGGTGGVVQFEWVHDSSGEPTLATHSRLHRSLEGIMSREAFLEPARSGGVPVILDPEGP